MSSLCRRLWFPINGINSFHTWTKCTNLIYVLLNFLLIKYANWTILMCKISYHKTKYIWTYLLMFCPYGPLKRPRGLWLIRPLLPHSQQEGDTYLNSQQSPCRKMHVFQSAVCTLLMSCIQLWLNIQYVPLMFQTVLEPLPGWILSPGLWTTLTICYNWKSLI